MKGANILAVSLASGALAANEEGSPIAKVIQMISDLQAKVLGEGEASQKEYDEFAEFCEDTSRNTQNEIKTGKATVEELTATIEEETANTAALNTKIEELTESIATDEADLKAATEIRTKEQADFAKEEKELVATIDVIGRAVGILEKEMAKSGASMVQMQNAQSVEQALAALVQASAINQDDAGKLTALVQSSQRSNDDDDDTAAPAAAAYKGQSGGIVDTLSGLGEEAETQLESARKKEQVALHQYTMLAQSLKDSIKFATKDGDAAKKSLAESAEKKSVAQGDLEVSSRDLSEDINNLGDLHQNCMTKAEDFEAETKSRGEELAALAKAKEIIIEATGGAASFLQLSDAKHGAAVRFVRDLAKKHKSGALAQLASRMESSISLSRTGDVFDKIKGLINDMIDKLEAEAEADATENAYCNKELGESNAKKDELQTAVDKLSTKIDQQTAKATKLKEEVAVLEKELAELATSQAKMDQMRQEEKALFTTKEAETSKGLDGIKLALKVLREYYAKNDKGQSGDAAGGIVGLLEVCESDFSKELAEMRTVEETAAAAYEQETKENAMTKTTKQQDAKYKQKEAVSLGKSTAEATADRKGVQAELDAVLEYLGKLEDRCVAKAESYEDRTAAREAEIAGLKEAMEILSGEAVLLQQGRRALRGVAKHRI